MSDSAPPPTPPENQGGATPPPPPPPAAPPPPAGAPYGAAPGYGAAATGPRPGELMDRFLARLIDLVIIFVVNLIIGIILGAAFFAGSNSVGGFGMGGSFAFGAISAIISTILYLGYFSYMESSQGRTLGKQIMKLHVTGPDGTSKPTMNEAVKRNLWVGLPILGIIPLVGLLAYPLILVAEIVIAVTINNDPAKRQSWFDTFAGGTQVIKEG